MYGPDFPIGRIGEGPDFAFRSYDHRGRVFGWEPPPGWSFLRAAFDVEAKDNRGGSDVQARYFGDARPFLLHWTSTEVAAKLLDVPILAFLRMHGAVSGTTRWRELAAPAAGAVGRIWLCSIDLGDHWATIGVVASHEGSWLTS